MSPQKKPKAILYKRYPFSSVAIYTAATVLHFLLGGYGIFLGYNHLSWAAYVLGGLYLVFAFSEMYLLMPLKVCPNCPYYRMDRSLCVSGLNRISKKIASPGKVKDFQNRSRGLFCPNNLYMASLVIPLIVMLPPLALRFSFLLLAVFLVILGLLLFRFFVIFPKIACLHCSAKFQCPQAAAMGVRDR